MINKKRPGACEPPAFRVKNNNYKTEKLIKKFYL